jgi:hypothetical protein
MKHDKNTTLILTASCKFPQLYIQDLKKSIITYAYSIFSHAGHILSFPVAVTIQWVILTFNAGIKFLRATLPHEIF